MLNFSFYAALEYNEYPLDLCIDLKKAFNMVNNSIELEHYGIRGYAFPYTVLP